MTLSAVMRGDVPVMSTCCAIESFEFCLLLLERQWVDESCRRKLLNAQLARDSNCGHRLSTAHETIPCHKVANERT